ncbi:hypothetical protein IQ251_17790 [Saccharopolyspora sp. HNM0983]|uniref:Uncharacterized protein n=1 Tax=Saccharopolyspora montiporae TaxID=2781240 RepID=A0A929BCK7_9PSEU|nr:hypothetical protein [Saccharopolyspora sp. HNM0983]MBE9376305.1 hypothetical protein [Saccharopolyspora sp. HNM0983]
MASRWQELRTTAEAQARAGEQLDSTSRGTPTGGADRAAAREALLVLTSTAAALARQLDMLASAYASPGLAEDSEVHTALDQAAAAAEDLGTCTSVAAQAIVEQD